MVVASRCFALSFSEQITQARISKSFLVQNSTSLLNFVSGLHNRLEFSQPLLCLYQAMQTRKINVYYCLIVNPRCVLRITS